MLEEEVNKNLSKLFNVNYLTTRPLGGLSAMEIVLSALAKMRKNPKIFSIHKLFGGHSATVKMAKALGYKHEYLPFKEDEPTEIDLRKLEIMAKNNPIDLVYLDLSCILFPVKLKKLKKTLGKDTIICYDGAHVLGLIANGYFQDPLKEGADIVCGSLHKTFFGPQRGIIMTNSKEIWNAIDEVANFKVSNRHYNDLASLGISVSEMIDFGKDYAKQTIVNSKALAASLQESGFDVYHSKSKSIPTLSHQVWIKFDNNVAKEFAKRAFSSNIILNSYLLPGMKNPGLRLGVQGITRLGMKEDEMKEIAKALTLIKEDQSEKAKSIISSLVIKFNKVQFTY